MATVQPSKPVKLAPPSAPSAKPAAPSKPAAVLTAKPIAPKPAAMKMPASTPTANGSKPSIPAIVATSASKPDDTLTRELSALKKENETLKAQFAKAQEEIGKLKNPNAHLSVYHPIGELTADSDADPALAAGDWRADLDGQKIALYPSQFDKGKQRVLSDVPPVLHFVAVPRASHPLPPGDSVDTNLTDRYQGFLHVWAVLSKDGNSVRGVPDLWRKEHILAAWPDAETAEPAKEEKPKADESTTTVYFDENDLRHMTHDEIKAGLASGEITAESFVWHGDDWIHLKDSPLSSLVSPPKKATPTKTKK